MKEINAEMQTTHKNLLAAFGLILNNPQIFTQGDNILTNLQKAEFSYSLNQEQKEFMGISVIDLNKINVTEENSKDYEFLLEAAAKNGGNLYINENSSTYVKIFNFNAQTKIAEIYIAVKIKEKNNLFKIMENE
jgi:hypothetical protein